MSKELKKMTDKEREAQDISMINLVFKMCGLGCDKKEAYIAYRAIDLYNMNGLEVKLSECVDVGMDADYLYADPNRSIHEKD